MRHSSSSLLASVFSTFLVSACSQGGSPLGVAEEEPRASSRVDSVSVAKDTAVKAPADPVPAKDTSAAAAAPAVVVAPAIEPAKTMSVVDSILAAGGPPAAAPAQPAMPGAGDSLPQAGAVPPEPAAGAPAAVVQPGPAGNAPGVFLATDLEGESVSCWNGNRSATSANSAGCGLFTGIGFKPFSLSETGIAHSGRKAIDITYAKNEEAGGTNVGIRSDSVNVRAYYYFEPGFDFGQGMKIGRVSSFNAASQKNDVDIILEARSAAGNQCGVTEMRDVGLFFNGAPKGSDWGNVTATLSFRRGRWYSLEYQVILNGPGKSDGVIRLWVDGVQVAARGNLSIRGSLGAEAKLNTVKIGGWYSNGAGGNSACANPSQPSRLHMDDIVIAKSYIGTTEQAALAGR
ncbi:MAG TPA: hypothetical protein VJ385_17025 [Fibrobacteria bacterium]|nr:hypothetical protein [Fibrobacteria bacterium]